MPASMFFEKLFDDPGRAKVDGRLAGPCAMGPVGDGDTIEFMRVWLFQLAPGGGTAALSTGESGVGVDAAGGDPTFPATQPNNWMIRTGREDGSGEFSTVLPAMACAVAWVKRADGSEDVEHWTQAVAIERHQQ